MRLGGSLTSLGRLDAAVVAYKDALLIRPDYVDATMNLGKLLWNRGRIVEAIIKFKRVLHLTNETYGIDDETLIQKQEAIIYNILGKWVGQSYENIHELLSFYKNISIVINSKNNFFIKFSKAYNIYLLNLYSFYENNKDYYAIHANEKIYVIGDSHTLSVNGIELYFLGKKNCGESRLIAGIKMRHVGKTQNNAFRACLAEQLTDLPNDADLLFCIGEIDCRRDEGMWAAYKKKGGVLGDIVANTVTAYLQVLADLTSVSSPASVTIHGIPAPVYRKLTDLSLDDQAEFLSMIALVNRVLEVEALAIGWNFLDVYSATCGENGASHRLWHLDDTHLQPSFYRHAEQWLKRPTKPTVSFKVP